MEKREDVVSILSNFDMDDIDAVVSPGLPTLERV